LALGPSGTVGVGGVGVSPPLPGKQICRTFFRTGKCVAKCRISSEMRHEKNCGAILQSPARRFARAPRKRMKKTRLTSSKSDHDRNEIFPKSVVIGLKFFTPIRHPAHHTSTSAVIRFPVPDFFQFKPDRDRIEKFSRPVMIGLEKN